MGCWTSVLSIWNWVVNHLSHRGLIFLVWLGFLLSSPGVKTIFPSNCFSQPLSRVAVEAQWAEFWFLLFIKFYWVQTHGYGKQAHSPSHIRQAYVGRLIAWCIGSCRQLVAFRAWILQWSWGVPTPTPKLLNCSHEPFISSPFSPIFFLSSLHNFILWISKGRGTGDFSSNSLPVWPALWQCMSVIHIHTACWNEPIFSVYTEYWPIK